MANRIEATYKFFKSLKNLVDQGVIKSIDQAKAFAKQEFGEVSDLMTLQINKIFKTKNQPTIGKKDPVFDNTVETIPFDDTGAPFNPRDPQKVYGKPKIDDSPAFPSYNETPGEFARRQTPGSKENILEQMKAAYPQRYNNLTGNETAAELKGIMEKANKTDVPFTTGAGATKKPKNRSMTADELEDFEMEIGDSLEGYDFDGTVEDGARILREQKKYTDDMFAQYKAEGGSKRLGGPKDPMADAIDNASPGYTGDLKYDAQLVADDLAEKMYGVEYDDLTQAQQMDLYDKAYTALSKNQQTLKGIKNTGKINISDPNVADDFTNFIKKNDPDGYKDLEQKITLSNAKKPKDRKDNSKGGRIKMAKGGLPNILGF